VRLSHIDVSGKAVMVDVSGKETMRRTAVAAGTIRMNPETVRLLSEGLLKKGDALSCARVAGILAAKQTSALIPLCHPLPIEQVTVDFTIGDDRIDISATAVCTARTGVEMEALTAVSVAALTLYDMCKAVDKSMSIDGVRLIEKTKETIA
jgi:cyclic pyranopterin monophosphate synthase